MALIGGFDALIWVDVNAVPTVPATAGEEGKTGVVEIVGIPAEATLIVRTLVAATNGPEVVAPIVIVNVPLVVGVPVICPLAVLNDKPGTTLPRGLGLTVYVLLFAAGNDVTW